MDKKQEYYKMIETLSNPNTIKLYRTKNVSDFENNNIKEFLQAFYSAKDPVVLKMSSLFNSILTHQNRSFMLSKRIMDNILESDPNIEIKSLRSEVYKDMLFRLHSNDYIETVVGQKNKRAALFKLKEGTLTKLLYEIHIKDYYDAQDSYFYKIYMDMDAKNNGENLTPEQKAIYKEIEEIKSSRRKG